MLIKTKGRITQVGPTTAIRLMCITTTNLTECFTCTKIVLACSRTSVKAEWAPLVTPSIITEEKNQCVFKFVCSFEMLNNPTNPLVNSFNHRREDRHPSCQVMLTILRQRTPRWVVLPGISIGNIIFIDWNKRPRGKRPLISIYQT